MTNFPDLFAALAAPFDPQQVRSRTAGGGQVNYITARTAMNRLDTVLGPEAWWDEYLPGENSVLCRLTIRLPDGSTLTKADAGGYAGMPDQGDDDKSGFSDAFKRAAVKFGVGRYLYRDGVPDFGGDSREVDPPTPPKPVETGHVKERGKWGSPKPAEPEPAVVGTIQPANLKVPGTGRALFAWTKEQEQRHEVGLLKYLNGWAKLQEFPGRMIDWDTDQVAQGYAEACRKLRAIAGYEEAS